MKNLWANNQELKVNGSLQRMFLPASVFFASASPPSVLWSPFGRTLSRQERYASMTSFRSQMDLNR